MPSPSDGTQLHERALEYVAQFLVRQFSALKGLKKLCVQQTPAGDAQKTTIIPMAVMHRDEKYTDETIRILQDLLECNLTGEAQVQYIPTCTH